MPVNGINHINIRTTDIATSAQFYVDVFDFEFRSIPMGAGQANWLFDNTGRATIHLRDTAVDSPSTGPIDHVALDCEGRLRQLPRDLIGIHAEFGRQISDHIGAEGGMDLIPRSLRCVKTWISPAI